MPAAGATQALRIAAERYLTAPHYNLIKYIFDIRDISGYFIRIEVCRAVKTYFIN